MEDKDKNIDPNNPDDPNNPGDKDPETYSKEEYDKVKTAQANQSKALDEERKLRKQDSDELKTFRDAETKRNEDEQKKKWKYLDLIEEKDKQILDMKWKAESWDKHQTERKETLTNEVVDLTSKLDPDVFEKNKFILDDLNLEKQASFLKNLTEMTWKKDFWKNPDKKDEKKVDLKWNDLKIADYEAKQKLGEKVSPTQRADYLNLLREKLNKS